MPKAKPDQVITHRIELGTWERQNIGKPISETAMATSVLAGAGVLLVGAGAAAAAYALWEFWKTFDDFKDRVVSTAENVEENPTYYGTGGVRKIIQGIFYD